MSISITPTKHLVRVYELLLRTYGEPKNEPDYDPLGGLIGTILSQHTSDINSDRAYKQLVATFPTWEDVRDAPMYLIAETIRSGELQQEQGGTKSLSEYFYDELTKRTSEDAWHFLRSMPGVGPKTAACVLMFNLNRPVMPIDTHVFRTSHRLGLIGPKVTVELAHTLFAKITPLEWVYPLHVNLIRHGRQICHAQSHKCTQCPLYSECAYVGSVNPQETAISD